MGCSSAQYSHVRTNLENEAPRLILGMNIPPAGKGKENMGTCIGRFMGQIENRGTISLCTFD